MSIIYFDYANAIVSCDTVVVKFAKVVDTCQPVIMESETNCNEVKIVAIISAAIVILAIIASFTVLRWKKKEIDSQKEEREYKKEKEKDEADRKLKNRLLDKYLDFLEEQTQPKEYVPKEKYEEQRRSFMIQLLQLLQCEKLVCLNAKESNSETISGDTVKKTCPEDKVVSVQVDLVKPEIRDKTETKDKSDTTGKKKEKAITDLVGKIEEYIKSEEHQAIIDQSKIDQYRQVLEYLIELSQKGQLDIISKDTLSSLFNIPKDEN